MNLRNILALLVLSAFLSSGAAVYGRGGGGGGGGGRGGGGGSNFSGPSGGSGGGRSASSAGGPRSSAGMRGGMRGSVYRPMAAGGRYPVYGGQAIRSGMARQQFVRSQTGSHHVARASTGQRQRTQLSGGKKLARAGQNETAQVSGGNQRMNRQSNEALLSRVPSGNKKGMTTRDGMTRRGNWARNNPKNQKRFGPETQERLRDGNGRRSNFNEARQRNNDCHNHHHNHDWWNHHCDVVIFWDSGWWGWWDGWWYPAWGYDPYYQSYEYDGPIYGYDGAPPDEVVANVQSELQRLGYFTYAVDGKLGPLTRSAINRYQRDNRLPITGTIDPATAEALGLQ